MKYLYIKPLDGFRLKVTFVKFFKTNDHICYTASKSKYTLVSTYKHSQYHKASDTVFFFLQCSFNWDILIYSTKPRISI